MRQGFKSQRPLVNDTCAVFFQFPRLNTTTLQGGGSRPGPDPKGCSTVSGVLEGGWGGPPFVDPNPGSRWVRWSSTEVEGGGGWWVPQHTYLKMIPMTR